METLQRLCNVIKINEMIICFVTLIREGHAQKPLLCHGYPTLTLTPQSLRLKRAKETKKTLDLHHLEHPRRVLEGADCGAGELVAVFQRQLDLLAGGAGDQDDATVAGTIL